MERIKLIIGASILFFGSLPVQAANFQIDYMMLEADLEDVDEFEPDAVQLKLIDSVGPNTEIVGVFAFGISDDKIEEFDPFFGTVSLSVDLGTMFGGYVRAHADVGASGQIFVQVGLVLLEYDLDAEIFGLSGSESYDDTGVAFGFGALFAVTDQAALVIEYNQLPDVDVEDIADIETTSLSVGFQVSF